MILPLGFFPGWLRAVAYELPFRAMMQMPIDIYLGKHTGASLAGALARRRVGSRCLRWAGAFSAGTRKLVIQGG